MSESGQNRKNSVRANVFWCTSESGHCLTRSACRIRAKSGQRMLKLFSPLPSPGSAPAQGLYPLTQSYLNARIFVNFVH
jgi:hypothetical protein